MSDKKLYYQEYHRKNFRPKPNFCDVCNADLTGSRKKRYTGCRIKAGQRVEDKLNWAIEFIEEYGYKVIKE